MKWRRRGLEILLAGSGVLHFAAPDGYRRIVPRVLGHQAELVAISGVAELVCAVLLHFPKTRRYGGWAAAGLLIAVFPANVQMAIDGGIRGAGFPLDNSTAAWLRLPLQIPLLLIALESTRQPRATSSKK